MEQKIYKRAIVDEVVKYFTTDEIVVLHGARQVGKTSIMRYLQEELTRQGKRTVFIDLEDSRYVQILDQGVEAFLGYLKEEGYTVDEERAREKLFVFIDEIQYLRSPSPFLKLIVDHHRDLKLIVSGSSSFNIRAKFSDTLAGRTVNFDIYNLSFREFLVFKGYYFDPAQVHTQKKIDELKALFKEFSLYGGYPKIVLTDEIEKKETHLRQIIDTYVKKDIRDLAAIKDVHKFNQLLEVLASQSGNLLNVTEVSNTCKLSKQTVEHYLFILEQTFIIKLTRPFHRNLRSELFKTPKVYFTDTGLMQILWLKGLQRELLGSVFETAIFAELLKTRRREEILYWRTTDKKEIDFVVRGAKGLLAIEVKLNRAQFQPRAMKAFRMQYKPHDAAVVVLDGDKSEPLTRYPWEL